MMTHEEKTSNFDDPPRDDRYYILVGGGVRYQTDDLKEACESLSVAVGVILEQRGLGDSRGKPVAFGPLLEAAKTDKYYRDGIVVVLYEDVDEPGEMIAMGYGFSLEEWFSFQPDAIKHNTKTSLEDVVEEAGKALN